MVILVDAWRGAVFTVDEEDWSGVVDMLETTEETIERSTKQRLLALLSYRALKGTGEGFLLLSGSASSSGALSPIESNAPKCRYRRLCDNWTY